MDKQLLADQSIAAADRVACLGCSTPSPSPIIARLTIEHITSDATGTSILFGNSPLQLPGPVAVFVAEHLQSCSRALINRRHN